MGKMIGLISKVHQCRLISVAHRTAY